MVAEYPDGANDVWGVFPMCGGDDIAPASPHLHELSDLADLFDCEELDIEYRMP